ncbi:MAG: hypothetical protein IJ265_02780, partial [Oscillospiraceae bacterium]|nr:hypothetical protein [Oscillospiraceae bacterium]
MNSEQYIAAVAVHSAAYAFDKPFHYLLPPELYRQHLEGCRVIVPFGRGNQKRVGLVLSVSLSMGETRKGLKPVLSVADSEPILNEEQLLLMHWLRDNTFCTYYDAIRTLLPSALQLRVQEHYSLVLDADTSGLDAEQKQLLQFLHHAKSQKEFDALLDVQDTPQKKKLVESLLDAGVICTTSDASARMKNRTVRMVRLTEKFLSGESHRSVTVKQQQ